MDAARFGVHRFDAIRPTIAERCDKIATKEQVWPLNGEGFPTPAIATAGRGRGPASESLPRRKPRGGRGLVGLGATYGDLRVAGGADVC